MFDHFKFISKYFFMILTVIFLITLFFLYWRNAGRRFFSVGTLSAQEAAEISSLAVLKPDLLQEQDGALLYNGVPLPKDEESGIYYLSQNMNASYWQGSLSCGASGCRLYFLEDEFLYDKAAALSSGHTFSLYAVADGFYQPVSLVITGLPLISLTSSRSYQPVYDKDLEPDDYYFNSQTRYYGDITIFNANPKSGRCQIVSSLVRFNERGASSAKYGRKKNYSIKLLEKDGSKNDQYLFDMAVNAKWKLITMFNDGSKIRDMTSLSLWQEIAEAETDFSEYGARMQYCEVILNGRYNGLYGVLYPIDADTLQLSVGDSLYKIVDFGTPSPDGFQYTLDNQFPIAYPVRLRYPEDPDQIVSGWIPYLEYLTYSAWTPDAYAFADLLDLRNVADFYIFIQATAAADNRSKNTYLVSRRQPDGTYTTYIIPWDLNYSFGEVWTQEPEKLYVTLDDDTTVIHAEPYIQELFDENINGARDILIERYTQYRKNILSEEHIISIMEESMDTVVNSGALARDTEICPDSGNSSDLTWTKNYVRERMAFLDEYFLNWE